MVYSAYAAAMESGATASLMVQTTAPVPPRQLTNPEPGVEDTMPAWSPNGREIAFTRIGPKDKCSLLLIPAVGGEARTISSCRPGWEGGFSWHPDGRHLVTSQTGPKMDGALYTIDLATGAWTRLPYQRDPSDTDLAPAYSPDGRWIAFHRNVSVSDVWRVPASGGKPERLTNLGTNINSIAWTPDGKSIVFGMYLDGNVSLARLDLQTRKVVDLGMPKTFARQRRGQFTRRRIRHRRTAFGALQPRCRRSTGDAGAGVPVDRPGPAAVGVAGWRATGVHVGSLGDRRGVVGADRTSPNPCASSKASSRCRATHRCGRPTARACW